MLASGAELGINRDHAGILELDGAARRAACPAALPDSIIEIDNKSITHRPDLWGHTAWRAKWPPSWASSCAIRSKLGPAARTAAGRSGLQIEDLDLCPRYSALVFENVTVQPSPLWLQYRLTAIGLNPINNIVDMTNFVMAELAQPMHAFDADLLARRYHLRPPGARPASASAR